jgi:purine-binding chemotaxis protein CheW
MLGAEAHADDEVAREALLVFRALGDACAVPLVRVREIVPCGYVTRVPHMPPWVRGVINLRGVVVPLVDLGPRAGLAATELSERACVLVVEIDHEGESQPVGLVVEAVSHVAQIAAHEIEPVPGFGTPLDATLLRGVGTFEARPVLILDLDRILSPAHIVPAHLPDLPEAPAAPL